MTSIEEIPSLPMPAPAPASFVSGFVVRLTGHMGAYTDYTFLRTTSVGELIDRVSHRVNLPVRQLAIYRDGVELHRSTLIFHATTLMVRIDRRRD